MKITLPAIAAVTGVGGALVVSANVGITSYGFLSMCACNALWMIEGHKTEQKALFWMNAAFFGINALGMVRYW